MTLPVITPEREPITLVEAMRIGQSASRLQNLTTYRDRTVTSGGISIQTSNGTFSVALSRIDTEAVLALLIEREQAFLAAFNVEITK